MGELRYDRQVSVEAHLKGFQKFSLKMAMANHLQNQKGKTTLGLELHTHMYTSNHHILFNTITQGLYVNKESSYSELIELIFV